MNARRATWCLLLAALQFAVLMPIAMRLYPGYRMTDHFLSDLGVTRTWEGADNQPAAIVFALSVVMLGIGMIVFAGAWRDYAFARGRTAWVGVASQLCGTLSGLAFVGVAAAPIDVALAVHNTLVVAAYGLLLGFAICVTVVWVRNGAPRGAVVAGALYAASLVGFFAVAVWVVTTDFWQHRRALIVGQKLAAAGSIAYVVYLTLLIRRRL